MKIVKPVAAKDIETELLKRLDGLAVTATKKNVGTILSVGDGVATVFSM